MKTDLLTLIVTVAVFTATLWARRTWPIDTSAHGRYYVAALLAISAMVSLIAVLRLIHRQRTRSLHPAAADGSPSTRPRQHYRLRFDHPPLPRFMQKIDDRQPAAAFSCPVVDASETGVSLDCTGIYAEGQTVQGEIIFNSGRTAPINGVVIRNESQRTCLRLHCTIDPPLLMAEQREQIARDKDDGPRPVISRSLPDPAGRALPSHSPKGICRLKRP